MADAIDTAEGEALSAPYVLEYAYHRSTGPVIGTFLGGLKQRRIFGVRARASADGHPSRVIVPPQEYDPDSAEPLDDFVEVGQAGSVTSWTWIARPRTKHPLQSPFAFALIQLDGADTAMLHCVDAPGASSMRTGMRVRAVWRDETDGSIRDIACFVPEAT